MLPPACCLPAAPFPLKPIRIFWVTGRAFRQCYLSWGRVIALNAGVRCAAVEASWGALRFARFSLRNIINRLALAVVALAIAVPGMQSASAQSFIEQLFGLNKPAPQPMPLTRAAVIPVTRSEPSDRPRPDRASRERAPASAHGGQSYQTMCVRTCDGYYWPLRYPAHRGDFKDDGASCQSECGSDARLYIRSGPGEDAQSMRDLDGNSYGASATAFAYRKGLVNGCACRPMPWSDSERARHERYALLDAEQKLRVAEADTNRVAAAQAALLAKQAPRTDVQMAQAATPGTDEGPAVGPNEAALLAAQNRREASASAAPKPPRSNARGRSAPGPDA